MKPCVPSRAGTPGPVNVHNSVPNTPSGEISSRAPIHITSTPTGGEPSGGTSSRELLAVYL